MTTESTNERQGYAEPYVYSHRYIVYAEDQSHEFREVCKSKYIRFARTGFFRMVRLPTGHIVVQKFIIPHLTSVQKTNGWALFPIVKFVQWLWQGEYVGDGWMLRNSLLHSEHIHAANARYVNQAFMMTDIHCIPNKNSVSCCSHSASAVPFGQDS